MSSDPVIPPDSRAVLIGVPHYQDARYLSYPAVGNSVDGMYELLVESGLCGWRQEQVIKVVNPANAGQLLRWLRELARETTGALLLYFVGHGVLSEHGELCLAVSDTDHADPDATGLEYTKVRRMLHRDTPATTRIVILDSCYSGRAIGLGSIDETQFANLSETSGAYTLTAADNFADVPPDAEGAPRTAFTGELLDLLTRDGIPGAPARLTLGTIYPRLRSRLASKGLPRPSQRADDDAAAFVFARNAAVMPAVARLPTATAESAPPAMTAAGVDSGRPIEPTSESGGGQTSAVEEGGPGGYLTPSGRQRAEALRSLGDVEMDAGNWEEARRLLQQAIEADPGQSVNATISLGWVERETGNLDRARKLFQQAIETGDAWQTGKALLCLGTTERELAGNREEARRLFKQAIETGQPGILPDAWTNLGLVEMDVGNGKEARRLFQQAVEAARQAGFPQQANLALMRWADMERAAGNHERARELYREVLDIQHPSGRER